MTPEDKKNNLNSTSPYISNTDAFVPNSQNQQMPNNQPAHHSFSAGGNPNMPNSQSSSPSNAGGFIKRFGSAFVEEGMRYSFRYIFGCITALILILILCLSGFFALRYFTSETTNAVKDSLPFGSSDDEKKNEDEDKFDNAKKIKTSVIVGKVEWYVEDAKDKNINLPGLENDKTYCSPREDYKFVYIRYTIRNVDRSFVTVPKTGVDLIDSEQSKYEVSSKTNKCLFNNETGFRDKYAPDILRLDEKTTREYIYEIPAKSKDLKIKVGDLSTVSGEYEFISLGF